MKIKVFVDEDYQVHNQEEVSDYVNEVIENSAMDMVNYFMEDINTRDNINPLFCALRDCDSEAFMEISKKFQEFLGFYKDNYISENFYESYVEI